MAAMSRRSSMTPEFFRTVLSCMLSSSTQHTLMPSTCVMCCIVTPAPPSNATVSANGHSNAEDRDGRRTVCAGLPTASDKGPLFFRILSRFELNTFKLVNTTPVLVVDHRAGAGAVDFATVVTQRRIELLW